MFSYQMRTIVRELFETAILTLAIFVVLQVSLQNSRVEGSSMEPTLAEGQYLFVNKMAYYQINSHILAILPFLSSSPDGTIFPFQPPTHGDVVVFKFPGDHSRDFVKRIVGLPGDIVEISLGQLYINGEAQSETYIAKKYQESMTRHVVPPNAYFVLGDNRRVSNDSRDWGSVPLDNLIGKAVATYWPLNHLGILHSQD